MALGLYGLYFEGSGALGSDMSCLEVVISKSRMNQTSASVRGPIAETTLFSHARGRNQESESQRSTQPCQFVFVGNKRTGTSVGCQSFIL